MSMKRVLIVGVLGLFVYSLVKVNHLKHSWHPPPPAYVPHYVIGCNCHGRLYGMLDPATANLVPASTMRKWRASQVQQAPSSNSSQSSYKPYKQQQTYKQTPYKPLKYSQQQSTTTPYQSYTPSYTGTYSGGSGGSGLSAPNPGIANQAWTPATPGAPSH